MSNVVHVYHGNAMDGLPRMPSRTLASPGGSSFGTNVNRAYDVNGDGYGDLFVGDFAYPGTGDRQGRAYVFLGSAGGIVATPARQFANPDGSDAYFGLSGAGGDVNGDDYADVAIGSYTPDASGRVHVHQGSSAGVAETRTWDLPGLDGPSTYFAVWVSM